MAVRDDDRDEAAAAKKWSTALKQCFVRRLGPAQVADAFLECKATAHISGKRLAGILFQSSRQPEGSSDPLLPQYLNHLLDVGLCSVQDVLEALLLVSPFAPRSSSDGMSQQDQTITRSAQEVILTTLSAALASSTLVLTHADTAKLFKSLLSWVQTYNAYETVLQIDLAGQHNPEPSLISSYEQLGVFLVVLLSDDRVRKQLQKIIPKAAKANISALLGHFATTLGQWSQSLLSQKLQLMLKIPPLVDHQTGRTVNFTAIDVATEVADLPRVVSRAGLYTYLNAALCGRPLVDDLHLISYLQARYGDDYQTMIGDLVMGTFDTLANALHRHESAHAVMCHRSFITNKVPLIVTSLSVNHLYQPALTEQYIQLALARIETHPFPPISSDTSGINDVLRDTRHDFIVACHQHNLLSQPIALGLLGQAHMPPSTTVRYNKQTLYNQIISNASKADGLVNELERMAGDAGAISHALMEALRHSAISKETASLKTLCTALTRKLPLLDIILQHCRLADILMPVCIFLNDWHHDEDQSELQPAYDDFASILLFTIAVIHRYDVSPVELDCFDSQTFVGKLTATLAQSRPIKSLDESETKILSQWIKGLFAVDDKGESIGISDETMSGCSPQTFYLLVPTLFEQIVLACKAKALNPNTLKGGLEFLLEPFLLPSLPGGLTWLIQYALTHPKDVDIALQIMSRLLKPTSVSGDAQMMHQIILGVLYSPLRQGLQDIERRLTNRKDVAQLIAVLKPFADSGYTTGGSAAEVREWTAESGTLRQGVADILTQLTTWSTQSDLNPIPTKYTHRTISVAIATCGAAEILETLVDEVTSQTAIGLGSSALEVATCLICAPEIHNTFQSPSLFGTRPLGRSNRLTIHQVLRFQLADLDFLMRSEFAKIETLVRLGRLVDAQSVITDVPLLTAMPMNITTEDLMDGIDTSAAAAVVGDVVTAGVTSAIDPVDQVVLDAAAAEFTAGLGDTGMDLTVPSGGLSLDDSGAMPLDLSDGLFGQDGDMTFDLGLGGVNGNGTGQNQGTGQPGTDEDDIFAGLDLGMMEDDDFQF